MLELTEAARARLAREQNIWFATVRAGGRPHLVPLWFVWYDGQAYVCIDSSSIKMRNLLANPAVMFALEDGAHPLVIEGRAEVLARPWPPAVIAGFQTKYDWLITADSQYDTLIAVVPSRLLMASDSA
jgi:F420H(2)-dependent biliverdin reductase